MINIKKEKYDNILGYTKKKKKKEKSFREGHASIRERVIYGKFVEVRSELCKKKILYF